MTDRNWLAGRLARGVRLLLVGALLAVVGQVVAWPRVARADILVVDTTVDSAALITCSVLAPSDCSLRGAILKANASPGADEIRFLPATDGSPFILTGAADEDENASGDLDILFMGGDLTIKGNGVGATILDGGAIDRVLHVCPPAGGGCGISVTIEGVTIRNGSATSGGGVENHAPSLTIRDSSIGEYGAGNQASFWGGGIFSYEGTLTLDGTSVYANTALMGAGVGNLGTLMVENGSAIGAVGLWNEAATYGGGIYNEGTATVDGSTVGGNQADERGGGIYNHSGTLTVQNGSTIGGYFNGNQATNDGGGIFNSGGTVVVDGSAVSANTATNGAGIYNADTEDDEAILTVRGGSTIGGAGVGNEASGDGGGIYNDGNLAGATVTVQDGSTVSYNTAADYGGGIVNLYGTLFVDGSSVSSNTAVAGGGGGIYNEGTVTVDGSTVSANEALNGGGIFSHHGTLTLNGSSVYANTANGLGSGGGGIVNQGGTLTLDGSTVSANSAGWGGGIWNSYYGTLTMQNGSAVSENTADERGGGIYSYGGTLTLNGSTVSANTANELGGGIYKYGLTMTLDGSRVSANEARNGGGIYNDEGTVTVQSGSDVSDNTAVIDGGGIWNLGTLMVQNGSTVHSNTAQESGGGIYNNNGTLTVDGSAISANTVITDGGGIYNDEGTVTVQNSSTVSGNAAQESGGGIYNNSGTVMVDGSAVSANEACDGGGIWNNGGLTVQNDSIVGGVGVGNSAVIGGGIFHDAGGIGTVDSSTVGANTAASGAGGGIFNRGTLTVRNQSTISGNSSPIFGGGGIYNSGTLAVQDSVVSDNRGYRGGGIWNFGSLTVEGSAIRSNTAAKDGGGIYNSGTMTLGASSTVSNNTAWNGSGIFSQYGASTTVTGSRILYNTTYGTTGGDGGGIYDAGDIPWATSVLNSCIVGNSDTAHQSVTQQWATDNWWGAPAGPNTPGADTAGPYIYTEGWLTAPILGCAPDLQIDKANDTDGSGAVGTTFHWTLTVTNNDIANAVFGAGHLILQDDLPPGPTYGTPVPGSFVDVTNADNIECRVTGNTLTCGKGIGEDVVIGAQGGGFSVVLPVTPQAGGVLTNPAGICRVDPGGNVVENDEGNNDCPADVVNVTTGSTASTATVITAHDPNPSAVGQTVTVGFAVSSAEGTPTGQVTVSDGTVQCTGALSGGSGSCTLAFPTAGSRVLTATYAGDTSFSGSISPGVTHSVGHPTYLPLLLCNW